MGVVLTFDALFFDSLMYKYIIVASKKGSVVMHIIVASKKGSIVIKYFRLFSTRLLSCCRKFSLCMIGFLWDFNLENRFCCLCWCLICWLKLNCRNCPFVVVSDALLSPFNMLHKMTVLNYFFCCKIVFPIFLHGFFVGYFILTNFAFVVHVDV